MAYTPKYGKKKKKLEWVFNLAAVLSLCAVLVGGAMLLKNMLQSRKDQAAFQELAALVDATLPRKPAAPAAPGETLPQAQPAEAVSPYQVLSDQNPDFVGWLTVPGTSIDYPVMHTPEDIEYYIYRNFQGEDSPSGTPFVGDYGSLDAQKCIIYGHNMGDGTMFHDLLEYLDKDFWQANPTFTISTLTQEREYEIFAAVQTRLLQKEERGLRFYRLEEGVEQWLLDHSLYSTGITPEAGDTIVILSTCSYHTDNGRFIIAGRLREEES